MGLFDSILPNIEALVEFGIAVIFGGAVLGLLIQGLKTVKDEANVWYKKLMGK